MNKDGPYTTEGGVPVPGTSMSQYDLAVLLAARATTDLYGEVRSLVASTVNVQNPDADGECVARKLFNAGFEPCAKNVTGIASFAGLTTPP